MGRDPARSGAVPCAPDTGHRARRHRRSDGWWRTERTARLAGVQRQRAHRPGALRSDQRLSDLQDAALRGEQGAERGRPRAQPQERAHGRGHRTQDGHRAAGRPQGLPRPQRHHRCRPRGAGRDAPLPAPRLGQSIQHPHPRKPGPLSARGRPPQARPGARLHGTAHPVHRQRLRGGQPRDHQHCAHAARQGAAHRHLGHRAPGGSRTLQGAGGGRVRDHLPAGERRRAGRSGSAGRSHPSGHHPGQHHGRQQRDRSDPADPRDGRDRPRPWGALPHRCGAGAGQDPVGCRRSGGRHAVALGAQGPRAEGGRSALHPPRNPSRAAHPRRRTGARSARGDRERSGNRRIRARLASSRSAA